MVEFDRVALIRLIRKTDQSSTLADAAARAKRVMGSSDELRVLLTASSDRIKHLEGRVRELEKDARRGNVIRR